MFFFSYSPNITILSQEGVRAYWSLVFNLLSIPSLHQLSLLYVFILPSYRLYIYYIYLLLHLLINHFIVTYYKNRQIYEKVRTNLSMFLSLKSFILKVFLHLSFRPLFPVVHHCSLSLLFLRLPVDRNIDTTSECVT